MEVSITKHKGFTIQDGQQMVFDMLCPSRVHALGRECTSNDVIISVEEPNMAICRICIHNTRLKQTMWIDMTRPGNIVKRKFASHS